MPDLTEFIQHLYQEDRQLDSGSLGAESNLRSEEKITHLSSFYI